MSQSQSSHSKVESMKAEGTWNPLWDGLNELDPEWTELYMQSVLEPYESGVLDPKVVQMLCIAADASVTHMFAPGTRRHIQMALEVGVTPREILEVLKLCTTIGIHSINLGAPILMEEMAAFEKRQAAGAAGSGAGSATDSGAEG